MKKIFILTLILSIINFPNFAFADEVFICQDKNKDLHFVLYEDANGTRNGHMYIKNIQVASLNTYRVNDITIRASVKGNSPDVEFIFNRSREQVFITIRDSVEEICNAKVIVD